MMPSLPALPAYNSGSKIGNDARKIQESAADFEALLIEQMLRSARESSWDESDETGSSDQATAVLEMSEQQFAQALAHNGGLGIAKMVVAGLAAAGKTNHENR